MATVSTVKALLDAADFLHRISGLLPEGEREAALTEAESATQVATRLIAEGGEQHGRNTNQAGYQDPREEGREERPFA